MRHNILAFTIALLSLASPAPLHAAAAPAAGKPDILVIEMFGVLGAGHSYLDANADSTNPILNGGTPVTKIDYFTENVGSGAAAFTGEKP